jgi:histidinol-phosphate aminotransferase
VSRFLNKAYAGLHEYVPGEQPQDMQYVKLNTNESPYPPSPAVLAAANARQAELLRLYPDPTAAPLRAALAARYGLAPQNVFIGNGSDEVLNFAFMAFAGGDTPAYFPDISYGFYPVFAQLHGIQYTELPLRPDFTVSWQAYYGRDGMIVIANPNAPTGLSLSVGAIEEILRSNPDHVVLIDEAYVDFGCESCAKLVAQYDNLLVVMTYSKSRSMAGARLGFALGNEALIADLEKLKYSTNPYNISRLTLACGEAALKEEAYYRAKCDEIMRTRAGTAEALRQLGFTVLDSDANFLFAKSDAVDGETLYLQLKARGVLVRHFTLPRIAQYDRITIGTPAQMEILLAAVRDILKEREHEA